MAVGFCISANGSRTWHAPMRVFRSAMSLASSAASRLCVGCGMCCDGSIFHTVRLQPTDSAKALAALGLKLKRKNGRDLIQQPCPAFRECRCSIYAARPERCRLFECRQLQQLAAGEISEAEAAEKIADALAHIARIHELFRRAGETNAKGPLTVRAAKILAEPADSSDPVAATVRAELAHALQHFEDLVEKDFRPK